MDWCYVLMSLATEKCNNYGFPIMFIRIYYFCWIVYIRNYGSWLLSYGVRYTVYGIVAMEARLLLLLLLAPFSVFLLFVLLRNTSPALSAPSGTCVFPVSSPLQPKHSGSSFHSCISSLSLSVKSFGRSVEMELSSR